MLGAFRLIAERNRSLRTLDSLYKNYKELEKLNPNSKLLSYMEIKETGREIDDPKIKELISTDFSYSFNQELVGEMIEKYGIESNHFQNAIFGIPKGLDNYIKDLEEAIKAEKKK